MVLEVRVFEEPSGQVGDPEFRSWEQDLAVDQPGEDSIQIEIEAVPLRDGITYGREPEVIVDLLEREVADIE
ncbi:MAG: hypothetical protein IJ198_03120 [Lachnospiraceae bacterium]|nr:hypothetical protein [Lachnospiraceae bacterium]